MQQFAGRASHNDQGGLRVAAEAASAPSAESRWSAWPGKPVGQRTSESTCYAHIAGQRMLLNLARRCQHSSMFCDVGRRAPGNSSLNHPAVFLVEVAARSMSEESLEHIWHVRIRTFEKCSDHFDELAMYDVDRSITEQEGIGPLQVSGFNLGAPVMEKLRSVARCTNKPTDRKALRKAQSHAILAHVLV